MALGVGKALRGSGEALETALGSLNRLWRGSGDAWQALEKL
jgi:hypothetical protein